MLKKFVVVWVMATVLAVSSLAFAGDVVVTKRGKKYHVPTCMLIQGKTTSTIDEQQAIAKGLKPCGKCLKAKDGAEETK